MKQRQANMELMRAVSMLLVLLVHTLFYANGRPTKADFIDQTASAFLYVEWEALALVCVNCFKFFEEIIADTKNFTNFVY